MSGAKYLVDTNCFIYLLDQNPILLPFADDDWAFSYITEIELLSKVGISSNEESIIRAMLENCLKVPHTQQLTELVINIKRNNKIKLPDAIIAASAKLLDLPLITADKGFTVVKQIDCIILDV